MKREYGPWVLAIPGRHGGATLARAGRPQHPGPGTLPGVQGRGCRAVKMAAHVLATSEMVEDGRPMRETLAILDRGTPPRHRSRRVWLDGYRAALEDIRSGRLSLQDGEFR